MKILVCDNCGEIIPLEYKAILCRCGSVGGCYLGKDSDVIGIYLSEITKLAEHRAIAIANEFLFGINDDHRIWVMPWNHPKIWYYIEENDTIMNQDVSFDRND